MSKCISNSYNQNLKCMLNQYDIYSGVNLNLDQFVVNSFMFISNEPLFVVSVDNFGLLVIDIVSKSIVDKLNFSSMIINFNSFTISNIFPIDKNGMRILIKDKGGFSLFWKRVAKIGDQEHVFTDLTINDIYISLGKGEISNLLDYSKEGYSVVVFKEFKERSLFRAYVRVYFNSHHEKSKNFKEIPIGIQSS